MLRMPTFHTGPSLGGGPSGGSESPSKYSFRGPSERVGASIKRSVQSVPYPPSGDVHAGCDWRKKSSKLSLSELSEGCVGTLGSQRRIANKAALGLGAGPELEQQPKLILPINGDAARGIHLPDLAVYYDGASCHQAERLRGREYNPESLSEAENLQPQSVHSRARDCELHRNCAGQAPQTGDRVLLLELRRRSDLAPLALATCLGEERKASLPQYGAPSAPGVR